MAKKILPPTGNNIIDSFKQYLKTLFSIDRSRIEAMSPAEKAVYRDSLRRRLKYGFFGFLGVIASGMTLYQRHIGTEESRLNFNTKKYLSKEELEVELLRKEIQVLRKEANKGLDLDFNVHTPRKV